MPVWTRMTEQYSFPKEKIKVLLLEGIHPAAAEAFRAAGYSAIECVHSAMTEEQLLRKIAGVHILGIRSKTELSRRIVEAGRRLISVGCFCIGTNQVDMGAATGHGLAVFNAPFSNTRSVAELTIAEVVMLARRAGQRSMEMHAGRWEKSAEGCVEVRQKTIGIVGYGHIGPQVGLLAEAMGMRVVFHDIVKRLPLGNARQAANLEEVLRLADFVTLHVPDTPLTRGLIGPSELSLMKKGGFLLNLSRGSVVHIEALRDAILAGQLGGAAVDVFPIEPEVSGDTFQSVLRNLPNVILTPHIGGSTIEAQRSIGSEVADSLISYLDTGSSSSCVNLPQVDLPILQGSHRVLNIHRDVPGVLGNINGLMAQIGVNIKSQYLNTRNGVGYLIMDVERSLSRAVKKKIDLLDTTIRTRLLF